MKEDKNYKGLVWLIIILIVLVLGLIGYIVYDKTLKSDDNKTNTSTTNTKTDENRKKNDLSDEKKEDEKTEDEKKLVIYNDVINMLDEFIKKEFDQYNIKFNYNYMDDTIEKSNIVISAMMSNDKIKKDIDVDVNNEKITGAITFNKTDFINTYNTITGEQPDFNKIVSITNDSSKTIEVKNNKISGSYVTWPSLYMLKLNEIVSSNNEYSIKIDYVYETDKNSEAIRNEYDNYEKAKTFDNSLVNSLIDINLNKNSDGTYRINYLKVVKK